MSGNLHSSWCLRPAMGHEHPVHPAAPSLPPPHTPCGGRNTHTACGQVGGRAPRDVGMSHSLLHQRLPSLQPKLAV